MAKTRSSSYQDVSVKHIWKCPVLRRMETAHSNRTMYTQCLRRSDTSAILMWIRDSLQNHFRLVFH
jgi:hypothetical protein